MPPPATPWSWAASARRSTAGSPVQAEDRASLDLVFLGCGAAAARHARTLARDHGDVRLHFASRDPARAGRFCAAHGGRRAFGSYAEAIADPDVGVVFVVTPPSSHLELVMAALGSGKHVIVEKPAFPGSSDFATVRAAATRANRRVLVAENYFYKPLRARLEEVLRGGRLGEPLFLRVNAAKYQSADDWRADPATAGGGALLEGGIHWVNLMASLGLAVRRVTGYRAGRGRGAAESAVLAFEYETGLVGTLTYSWRVPSPLRGLRCSQILGTEGTATFESNGIFLLVRGKGVKLAFPGLRDLGGYRAMFGDFLRTIRGGGEPAMTLEMAERDVRLVEEAIRSMDDEGNQGQG